MKEGLAAKPPRNRREIIALSSAALAGPSQNGYIRLNLWFSYDRVLRVGPPGPALFYYLNLLDAERRPGAVRAAQSGRGPAATEYQLDRPS